MGGARLESAHSLLPTVTSTQGYPCLVPHCPQPNHLRQPSPHSPGRPSTSLPARLASPGRPSPPCLTPTRNQLQLDSTTSSLTSAMDPCSTSLARTRPA